MKVIKIVSEKLTQNNYLIVDGNDAVLVDGSAKVAQIEESLKMYSPKPKISAIFITHAHFDHIMELDNLAKKYECPVFINKDGKKHLYDEKKNLSVIDKPFTIKQKKIIKTFVDGEEFVFGNIKVNCFVTPGHSIDSSVFKIGDNLFTGDTIFKIGVGRTDMFSGDRYVQHISLLRLRDENGFGCENFYSGHGVNFNKDELMYNIEHYLGDNEWI
jgi:glyoxylase-like metal-dependent hydrolase (beta-lactamase superfamily II)